MRRSFLACFLAIGLVLLAGSPAGGKEADDYLTEQGKLCDALLARWRQARDPEVKTHLGNQLQDAAVRAERPGVVDQVIAGGHLAEKEIRVPHRARRVRLHDVQVFDDIRTSFDKKNGFFNDQDPNGWLVRRMTSQALEVWTPRHGWLFNGQGRLLNEARPPRRDGNGREWYGAFLPDGRWVTTDLWKTDCTLTFFSREGRWLEEITSAELAPPGPANARRAIIGWGRSDKDGAAWVVNVGSEGGYATVRIGPDGPARVLSGIERWHLCYPRALGPRGWYLDLEVPDDAGRRMLVRLGTGHGEYVDYPGYSLYAAKDFCLEDSPPPHPDGHTSLDVHGPLVPDGNHVFGFWPGRTGVFIGAEPVNTAQPRPAEGYSFEDQTWFFTRACRFQGWVRARRLADGADGRTMLFRLDDDSRVAALRPNLGVAGVRRFVWANDETADAVQLFDDLRLGLFVRGDRLVLARW